MAINTDNMFKVISNNKEKKINATKIIESNRSNIPVVSKLITDKNATAQVDNDYTYINRSALEQIFNRISGVKNNNKNIMELFPDIELAVQILVSSILSPKKMTDVQLNYKFDKNLELNPELTAYLLDNIKEYVNDEYELEDELPDIIREALFESGASVYAIVPESSIDEVINSDLIPSFGLEEFKERVGYALHEISKPKNILSLEKFDLGKTFKSNDKVGKFISLLINQDLVRLTDNPSILSYGEMRNKITSSIITKGIRSNTGLSMESIEKIRYLDVFRDRSSSSGIREVQIMKQKSETIRDSVGKPMVSKFPTESIIPVFIPGNEKDHVGYFVLLDESGKPMSGTMGRDDFDRLNSNIHQQQSNTLTPVQKAYKNLISNTTDGIDVNSLFEMYKTILEKQLFSTIKSSLYSKDVNIANRNEIYFMMFCRALQDQRTGILFIPKEQIVYFAFQYNELGIGKSLLENLAVQSSLRAIMLFAKIMGFAKQSIDVTKVNISLDPNDPDPEKTIEEVQASVLKLRQNFLPLGINNPVDLVNWIQRAGLHFSFENNPRLPDIKIDFDNSNLSHTLPDDNLEEELRKQSIIALGLPPETIDNGFSPEFARTVINNNILLSKRVSLYQKKLKVDLSKYVSLLIHNDEDLRGIIKRDLLEKLSSLDDYLSEKEKGLMNENKEEFLNYYIDKIADCIYIDLPKPEDTDLTNLAEEFDLYRDNLDRAIDAVVSSDIFTEDVSGEMNQHIDTLKNIYRSHLLRKWMADNNYMTELLEISSTDREEVDDLLSSLTIHLSATMRNNTKLLEYMKKFRQAVDKDLSKIMQGEDLSGGDSSGFSGGASDAAGGGDEGGDDEGGEDEDFDLDF